MAVAWKCHRFTTRRSGRTSDAVAARSGGAGAGDARAGASTRDPECGIAASPGIGLCSLGLVIEGCRCLGAGDGGGADHRAGLVLPTSRGRRMVGRVVGAGFGRGDCRSPSWTGVAHRRCHVINGPGAQGTEWRAHVQIDAASGRLRAVELTDVHGGERFDRQRFAGGEVVLGDRGYATARGIAWVHSAQADVVVRFNPQTLRLCDLERRRIDLQSATGGIPALGGHEWKLLLPVPPDKQSRSHKTWPLAKAKEWIPVRVVAARTRTNQIIGSSPPRQTTASALSRSSNSIACAGKSSCCSNVSNRCSTWTACRRDKGRPRDLGCLLGFWPPPWPRNSLTQKGRFPPGIRDRPDPIARGHYSAWPSGRFVVPSWASDPCKCSNGATRGRGSNHPVERASRPWLNPLPTAKAYPLPRKRPASGGGLGGGVVGRLDGSPSFLKR